MITDIEKKEIDGHTYTCRPFGAKEGLRILTEMFRLIDVSVVDSFDNVEKIGSQLLAGAQKNITPDILMGLVDKFAGQSCVLNSEGISLPLNKHFDSHFSRRYSVMLQWIWWVLEVNYASFFDSKKKGESPG